MKASIAIVAFAMLAGCEANPASANAPVARQATVQDVGYEVVVDAETGCEYWHADTTGFPLVPRYEAGGRNSSGSDLTRVRGCR